MTEFLTHQELRAFGLTDAEIAEAVRNGILTHQTQRRFWRRRRVYPEHEVTVLLTIVHGEMSVR